MHIEDRFVLAALKGDLDEITKILESNTKPNINCTSLLLDQSCAASLRLTSRTYYPTKLFDDVVYKSVFDKDHNLVVSECSTKNKLMMCLKGDYGRILNSCGATDAQKSSTARIEFKATVMDWEIKNKRDSQGYYKLWVREYKLQPINALQAAIFGNKPAVAKLLLDQGINPQAGCVISTRYTVEFDKDNAKSGSSDSNCKQEYLKRELDCLDLALVLGREEIVALLFTKLFTRYASPSEAFFKCLVQADSNGYIKAATAPNNYATKKFNVRQAFELYEHAAHLVPLITDLNTKHANDDTLLHLAIKKGCYKLAKELIRHGADTTLLNKQGLKATDCCPQGFDSTQLFSVAAEIPIVRATVIAADEIEPGREYPTATEAVAKRKITRMEYISRLFMRVPATPTAAVAVPVKEEKTRKLVLT